MPIFDEKRYKNGSETEVKSEPFVIRLSEDYVFHDTCLKHLQYELEYYLNLFLKVQMHIDQIVIY